MSSRHDEITSRRVRSRISADAVQSVEIAKLTTKGHFTGRKVQRKYGLHKRASIGKHLRTDTKKWNQLPQNVLKLNKRPTRQHNPNQYLVTEATHVTRPTSWLQCQKLNLFACFF